MATIVTRDTGVTAVNRPLTNAELDANFINLNVAISSGTAGGTSYSRTSITASAGQTTFTTQYNIGYVQVYVNGVLLNSADYTATTGTSIVLAIGVAAGSILEVVTFTVGDSVVIGSQNIDGGIPSSTYSGILTTIRGGTPTSPNL